MTFFKNHYGSIVFCCFGIMLIPQLFFQTNSVEFGGDLMLVALPVLAGLIALTVLWLLLRRLQPESFVQPLLTGIGVAILLCDLLFRAPLTALDGSATELNVDAVTKFGSLAVFVGVPLACVLFAKRLSTLCKDLALIAALIVAGLTGYSVFLATTDEDPSAAPTHSPTPSPTDTLKEANTSPQRGTRPNVYLIWLDGLQTDYVQRYLEDADNNSAFAGFTQFENHSSNYLYTMQSSASFMSGTLYRTGSYAEWATGSDRLRQKLLGLGYQVTAYAKSIFVSTFDSKQIIAEELFASRNEAKHPFVADFVTYWLIRSAPAAAATWILDPSRAVGTRAHDFANPNQRHAGVQTIADGIEPLSGVFTLEQLAIDERDRADKGEVVIAQAIIPHAPFVIDNNCNYQGKRDLNVQTGYYQQVQCAMDLTGKYLQELKRLDRFDESLIVIFGDHGSGWAGLLDKAEPTPTGPLNGAYMPWTELMIASRASAGMLIKAPGGKADSPVKGYPHDSQLIDLYPTVLTLLDSASLIEPETEGQSLFGPDKELRQTTSREKFITYFKPSQTLNLEAAEIYDLATTQGNGYSVSLRGPFRSLAQMPALECSKPISFGNDQPDGELFYRTTGISGIEPWGRWSMAKQATITFRAPPTDCANRSLQLTLRAFIAASHPSQTATIALNGESLGAIEFRHAQANEPVQTFSLPEGSLLSGELNRLDFEFATPMSPKALGLSVDPRLLGLGFKALQID